MNEKTLLKQLEGYKPLDLRLAKPGCLIRYFYFDKEQNKYIVRLGGYLKEINCENNYLLLMGINNKVSWKVYMQELPDRPAPTIYYKMISTRDIDKLKEYEKVINLIDNNSDLNELRTETSKNLDKLMKSIKKTINEIDNFSS